jgi:hypothetical protein
MDIDVIETPFFKKQSKKEDISSEDIMVLKKELICNPEKGDLIPKSGGLRKIRLGIDGKGKRGGARVIYLYIVVNDEIYLLHIYKKSKKENLTEDELKALRKVAQLFKGGK